MRYLLIASVVLCITACESDSPTQPENIQRNDSAYKLDIDLSGSLQNPAFSPDGESIVFTRFQSGYNSGASDLFVFNFETGEVRALVSDGNGNVNLPGSVWNGAINSVVFSSAREPHDEIFMIQDTASTGDEVQLTSRPDKQCYEPSFSPDGQWIVFESHTIDTSGDGVITKYRVDGSSTYIDLTSASDDSRQPNWSPAGDRILYQKEEAGKWAIWSMNIDGQANNRITSNEESCTDAVFSSDGEWIIYSSENDQVELSNIYRIPSAGGSSIRVTDYDGYDGAPSVSPDGTMIVFESTDGDPDSSGGSSIWLINLR